MKRALLWPLLLAAAVSVALAQVPAGLEFRVNSHTASDQRQPTAIADPAGTREQMGVFISGTFGLRLYGP